MKQPRLNHVILLHMYKERLGRLDLDIIGNEFVSGIEQRLRIFSNFKTEYEVVHVKVSYTRDDFVFS